MEKDGNLTIKIAVHFWTNVDQKKYPGMRLPKRQCTEGGFVGIVSNKHHGIRAGPKKSFRQLEEIPSAIQDVMKRSHVTMIARKNKKVYAKFLWDQQQRSKEVAKTFKEPVHAQLR